MSASPLEALIAGGLDLADNLVLRSPGVGLWQPRIGARRWVRPGDVLGHLHVLGVAHPVIAPAGARGIVSQIAEGSERRARVPVGHGAPILRIDPGTELGASGEMPAIEGPSRAATGLVFTAPTSGRFYSRPGPGKAPFVTPGAIVRDGQTVCLLEVMKTFNRVVYEAGHGMPAEAKVIEVVAQDEADVDAGAPLLRLEAVT